MKKKVILLVEDDELDVISVKRSLKKMDADYELITAYNGIEALDLLRAGDMGFPDNPLPDIILLDINMPKMNGIEFLSLLRADEKFKQIKVFIMTTSGEEHDRSVTHELGISGYLVKPLNFTNNYKKADSMEAFVQFHLGKILREEA